MNKKLKFILTTLWILLSRSFDAYCTYLYTPDLSREANPLVTMGGISTWTTLLIILSILTIYVIYAYYISVFKPMKLLPVEKGYSFSNMIAYVYLGRKDKWPAIFYKLPNSLKRFNNYMGHLFTKCLVYAGIISTIMWLLLNHTEFYKSIHSPTLIYSILVIGCLVIGYIWNKSLYKKYLMKTA